jgi:hypothetical protein
MAYIQKSNPFKKKSRRKTLSGGEVVFGEGTEEGQEVKTKTKLDKDGNIVWSKTKKKGKLRYKKDKPKTEKPPNPMPRGYDVKPTDPGKTYQA